MKFDNLAYKGLSAMSCILLVLMTGLCVLQVICRYVLKISLSFTEELARFLFIWITFLGTAMAVKKNQHVKMELLLDKLPDSLKLVFRTAAFLLTLLTYGILMYSGAIVVWKTMRQTSAALNLPMGYIYASVPVSVAFMLVFEFTQFIGKRAGKQK